MPAALAPYAPYLATAAIGWAYYRRIRRSFGRQRWHFELQIDPVQ